MGKQDNLRYRHHEELTAGSGAAGVGDILTEKGATESAAQVAELSDFNICKRRGKVKWFSSR